MPSTATATLLIDVPIAVVLSIAHPATVVVPDSNATCTGASMCTEGGPLETLIMTVANPTSLGESEPVADTVSMCGPGASPARLSIALNPTFGHPIRPGHAAQTSARPTP